MNRATRFVLDTSAVIDLPPEGALAEDAEFLVTSITVAELNAGVHLAPDVVERSVRIDRLLWMAETLDVLPFTESAARMYGQLNALMIAGGRNPRSRRMDLLIASVAAVGDMPLITRNARDVAGLEPLLQVVALD